MKGKFETARSRGKTAILIFIFIFFIEHSGSSEVFGQFVYQKLEAYKKSGENKTSEFFQSDQDLNKLGNKRGNSKRMRASWIWVSQIVHLFTRILQQKRESV